MELVGAKEIRSRGVLPFACLESKIARVIGSDRRFRHTRRRDGCGVFRRREIAARRFRRVEELRLLCLECGSPRSNLGLLPLAALAVEISAVKLLAQLAQRPVTVLDIGTRHTERGTNLLLMSGVRAQRLVGCAEGGLELRKIGRRALELGADAARNGIALASLFFCTLTTRSRVAETLLRNGDLSAQLLGALALVGDESAELRAPGLSGRAGGEGSIPRRFRGAKTLFFRGHFRAKARDSLLESEKIAAPGVHLAGSVRDLESQ